MKKQINQKGITLIALVITIIVLLILAGVSIAMLTGENGILTQAQDAKRETTKNGEKEQLRLAYMEAKAEKLKVGDTGAVTADELKKQIEDDGVDATVTPETSPIEIEFNDTHNRYTVDGKTGEITGPTNSLGGNPPPGGEEKFANIDKTQTNPAAAMPEGATVEEPDGNKGIVIKDSAGNEWVWIEVPKNIYKTAKSNEEYDKIEADMQEYAKDYRSSSYTDTWYSEEQHGLGETEYNNLKETMLKSVYDNGGFFIGRYEVGTETPRYTENDELTTPLIKQDKYPYTFVTCTQAQTEAKKLSTGGKTSSLMFGIQWDLVCKFIEEKGYLENGTKITKDMIDKSIDWGNFIDATFKVTRGKYTTEPETLNSWQDASNYDKPTSYPGALLTTGATTRNRVLNIYDLAGNVEEWTFEKSTNTDFPCSYRGSVCVGYGNFLRSFYP